MTSVVHQIAQSVERVGGRTFIVGGYVRDRLLGVESRDIDLEIFGLPIEQIENILKQYGRVDQAGKQFAILLLQTGTDAIEVAAPRREIKTGSGHRGFSVEIDPHLSPIDAARRRDFTINAIMLDPLTEEIIDPFNGQSDLQQKILRVVDEHTFQEDPLRVLRAIQITARLGFTVERKTLALLQRMVPSVAELPAFRFAPEWTKLFLESNQPSRGLKLAQSIGYFMPVLPELAQLEHTEQSPLHHPEGNVWNHTLLTVDAAAHLARLYHPDSQARLIVMLAAWLHGIGKVKTTQLAEQDFIAYGHAEVGAEIAQKFLQAQGFGEDVWRPVSCIIREHMHLFQLEKLQAAEQLSDGALRRLVNRLAPAIPAQLLTVREADHGGRGLTANQETYTARTWFLPRLEKLGLQDGPVGIMRGQDLLDLGWPANNQIGEALTAAEQYAEESDADRDTILNIFRSSATPTEAIRRLHPGSL